MCGIAGLIDSTASRDGRERAVGRMCQAMLHRGPTDEGSVSSGPLTMGMRRLAIFDPAHGHQPMHSADGRYSIVFNGAIYNFLALRTELEAAGFRFSTRCDTEVLLAAYVHWGVGALDRLRGMYAFAVWDSVERELVIARDPFGIKPLYYLRENGRLLFASELNALFASGVVRREIDPSSTLEYLAWFAVPAPRTIYRGVMSLRPGEYAVLRDDVLTIASSWTFNRPSSGPVCSTQAEFNGELRHRLEDTIRAHVAADVPVGAFLSGGLDSAVITGLMTKVSGSRLKTFSIEFEERAFSEGEAAGETARFLGTDHHPFVLTGRRVAADINRILDSLDHPSGDGINTYYASLAAHDGGVTVVLSGLGGDELFGGYPSFKVLPKLKRWLPAWWSLPAFVRSAVVSRLRRGGVQQRKLADFLEHARTLQELGALQRRVFTIPTQATLLSPDARAHLRNRYSPFHPQLPLLSHELAGQPDLHAISAWELRTYMADVLLHDSDVMSMRHSIELRVPFIDRTFIEWLWHQPAHFKFTPHHPKAALEGSVGDLLPPTLLGRRKQGFTLPFAVWMKRELRPFLEDCYSESSLGRSGLFDTAAARERWRGFLESDDPREWSRVWSLAILIQFVNRRSA